MPIDGAPRTQARGYPISHLELCKIICLTVRRRCLGGLAQSQHRRTRDLQGRKFAFPLFLGLVVDFLPFCTAGCTHSCLKSRYFLPFLTSHKNRLVRPVIACKTMSFSPHNRLQKVPNNGVKFPRGDCIKPGIFCVSSKSNSSFSALDTAKAVYIMKRVIQCCLIK